MKIYERLCKESILLPTFLSCFTQSFIHVSLFRKVILIGGTRTNMTVIIYSEAVGRHMQIRR